MSFLRVCILGFIGALLLGCGGDAEVESVDVPDSVSEITEPMTGARLVVEVADTEIDLTGVISVRVVMEWGDGVSVELIEPNWEDAGWSGVTERGGEIVFDGVVFSRVVSFELEPFLGGEYLVPSIGIRADSDEEGRRIARLQPIEVVVTSVLEEGDGAELDPAAGLASLNAATDERGFNWGIWGGLGVAVVAGIVVLWLWGREDKEGFDSIESEAVLAIAASSEELSETDLGALHRALEVLREKHTELGSISHEIERARFSGGSVDHRRVQLAAIRAAEICGVGL